MTTKKSTSPTCSGGAPLIGTPVLSRVHTVPHPYHVDQVLRGWRTKQQTCAMIQHSVILLLIGGIFGTQTLALQMI